MGYVATGASSATAAETSSTNIVPDALTRQWVDSFKYSTSWGHVVTSAGWYLPARFYVPAGATALVTDETPFRLEFQDIDVRSEQRKDGTHAIDLACIGKKRGPVWCRPLDPVEGARYEGRCIPSQLWWMNCFEGWLCCRYYYGGREKIHLYAEID